MVLMMGNCGLPIGDDDLPATRVENGMTAHFSRRRVFKRVTLCRRGYFCLSSTVKAVKHDFIYKLMYILLAVGQYRWLSPTQGGRVKR